MKGMGNFNNHSMADALDASIEAGVPGNEAREEPIAMVHPAGMPRKRFYRQRAHCNPFSDHKIDLYFYLLF